MRRHLSGSGRLVIGSLILVVLFIPLLLNSGIRKSETRLTTSTSPKAFIQRLAPEAQRLGEAYGIRPSILLAQAAKDSDFGRQLLASKYHNLYRTISVDGRQNVHLKTVVKDATTEKTEEFYYQVYPDWETSMQDYLDRLAQGELGDGTLYTNLSQASDYKEASSSFILSLYTADPDYADDLVAIIEKYKLEQYDKE